MIVIATQCSSKHVVRPGNSVQYMLARTNFDDPNEPLAIHRRLREERLSARMLLQIHDELVFEVPEDELLKMEQLVVYEMEKGAELAVPLKVDINNGYNWSEAH